MYKFTIALTQVFTSFITATYINKAWRKPIPNENLGRRARLGNIPEADYFAPTGGSYQSVFRWYCFRPSDFCL